MVTPSLGLNCMSEQADLATAERHNIDQMTRFNDVYVVAIQMVQGPT